MKLAGALIWGAILGAAAVLLHSAFVPCGVLLAILGSGVGIWMIGRAWGARRYKVLAGFGWAFMTWRGGAPGIGGEILVQGNFAGNALVVAGFAMLFVAVATKA